MMPSVGLYTLGCKVSLYETEAITEAFRREGFRILPFGEVCDVYVINTCTVTAESDAKSRKYIRRAIRSNPDAVVIAIGCYTQRAPEEVLGIDGVRAVIGTDGKLSAVDIAKKLLADKEAPATSTVAPLDGVPFEPMTVTDAPRTRAYVKIEDGCECKCSYCAISPARGPVRSKPIDDVIAEVEGLSALGTKEIVLTGIETGSYGSDLGMREGLAELLEALSLRGSAERIRLGSMAPELLSEKFIDRVAHLPILVPHFHISMQSGSDKILRLMRRRYSYGMAMNNIKRIRTLMPRVMLTADLMVGFPTEDDSDFLDTVRFVQEAELLDAHVFAYSKRKGTPAADFDGQIPEEIKKERSASLIRAVRESRDRMLGAVVERGELLPTVFETRRGNSLVGHSDSYIEVEVRCSRDLRGELCTVLPEYFSDGKIYGKLI